MPDIGPTMVEATGSPQDLAVRWAGLSAMDGMREHAAARMARKPLQASPSVLQDFDVPFRAGLRSPGHGTFQEKRP